MYSNNGGNYFGTTMSPVINIRTELSAGARCCFCFFRYFTEIDSPFRFPWRNVILVRTFKYETLLARGSWHESYCKYNRPKIIYYARWMTSVFSTCVCFSTRIVRLWKRSSISILCFSNKHLVTPKHTYRVPKTNTARVITINACSDVSNFRWMTIDCEVFVVSIVYISQDAGQIVEIHVGDPSCDVNWTFD